MKPISLDAYRLLHKGSLALARAEANGIRIDVDQLDSAIRQCSERIKHLSKRLREDEIYQVWKKAYGDRMKLGSREQLGKVLFDHMGMDYRGERTATGRYQVNEEVLSNLDLPFTKRFNRLEKLKKLKVTYLEGIRREVINGFLHPSFNLHTVSSYRSSSSAPNFQNIPIRDPKIGKVIRQCFIPREGHVLIETDYSGIEVRIAYCYHQDPTMREYLFDSTKDMHRDMAMEVYKISKKDWKQIDPSQQKQIRYCGKNQFVFPQFYGSVWFQCAPALWESCTKMNLQGPGGIPLREHLANQGMTKLGVVLKKGKKENLEPEQDPSPGTFGLHVQQVEQNFWQRRFPVYTEWKKKWVQQYREKGYFDMKTGFRCQGLYRRNQTINLPVQGAAFHCLLWSFIEMDKAIRKRKMRAKLVGQIHDSILADVPIDEVQDYLHLIKEVISIRLGEAWKWLLVPMEVEVDVAESNWHDKKTWVEIDGRWISK